ncbi:MAG TPA: CDP-alcohol phosphatidyltransferase family protein [Methanoculleus sp.]|nr:CDP-alcohol phosphatidyltransferase family protein [Methanoculleus sp.]
MTLDRLRPHGKVLFAPLVRISLRAGLTPNTCSVISLLGALGAGIAFSLGEILPGVVLVAANAVFDAMDGAIARELGVDSKKGDFLDHVLDRYADIFIITGVFAGGAASWQVGVFALTGVLMSSYLGTQAQAVGVGRFYGGIMGRADRLLLLMIAGILDVLIPGGVLGMPYLGWLLVIFGVLGNYTAIQRFVHVWKQMDEAESP